MYRVFDPAHARSSIRLNLMFPYANDTPAFCAQYIGMLLITIHIPLNL